MAKKKDFVRTAAPHRSSQKAPKGMPTVRKTSSNVEIKISELISGGADVEATEGDISWVPRMAVAEILNSVHGELRKMKEDH